MGVFNTLTAEIDCPTCSYRQVHRVQFKYGCSRMNEFKLGDEIWWGYNNRGRPWPGVTLTYGITQTDCASCGKSSWDDIVRLHGNKIVAVWTARPIDEPFGSEVYINHDIHFEGAIPVSSDVVGVDDLKDRPYQTNNEDLGG